MVSWWLVEKYNEKRKKNTHLVLPSPPRTSGKVVNPAEYESTLSGSEEIRLSFKPRLKGLLNMGRRQEKGA